ncbi:AAA family ATPase [Rhizobium leguminosarum]|uniref:AAA family ATPase n=1 Tax=Rhizobium leguminosarum TaxID=384 RepID=UPI0010302553|nr:AAA family ATPase [Rhizobium leguminosarum]TAY98675.1 AAA family ATPase [Rhizobium leguminosarum]TAZ09440.1 AAA family ATPase [Rhizobium leguminosarum]
MTSLKEYWLQKARPPANFVTTVAEMAVRRTIRPFRAASQYVLAIRLPDARDLHVYETAARGLIDPLCETDDLGNAVVLVTNAANIKARAWDLVHKFSEVRKALIFYTDNSEISNELALLIDHRITMDMPVAGHFLATAKTLGLAISHDDSAFLATCRLCDIRLALRPNRSIRNLVQRLKAVTLEDSPPSAPQSDRASPLLEELSGLGEAKTWGLQIAADIKAWMAGEIQWADIDKGIVLAGPSGCGKTTFPKALANSCGIALVTSSAGAWQANGHLGDMLKAMRKTFKEAAAIRPVILFIDELDSLGDREAYKTSDYHDYKRQVVNAMLECLDPAEGRDGIIVVGATNDPSAIDAALLRPGRFERVIEIQRPNAQDRKAILKYHLPELSVMDFEPFVVQSDDWSGAEIEKLAREARRIARRSGRKTVTDEDLLAAMPPLSAYTEEEGYRLAIHEIGHAVVGATLRPDQLLNVKINRWRPSRVGWNRIGVTYFNESSPLMMSESYMSDTIAVLLSGMAAERIFFGEHSMASGGNVTSDLNRATDLATMMERCFAFGDNLVTDIGVGERPMENLRQADRGLQDAVRRRLDAQRERVMQILTSRRTEVQSLAKRLAQSFELFAEDILQTLRGGDFDMGGEP